MKLYRHYKKKTYKYVGIAKHSETLEDLVVYECRYPNDLGKLWVRPREIFEGLHEGKPRFEKIESRIEMTTTFADREIELVRRINEAVFPDWDQRYFIESFVPKREYMLLTAFVDDQIAGYKLGYRSTLDNTAFYSWLGGVHPDFRGVGLAEDLMALQHEWAKKQGYKKITTRTMNRFRAMLALNIKAGFEIVKAENDPKDDRFKIHLEKNL